MLEQIIPVTPSIDELSRTISGVAAPAFLLGGVAAFISVQVTLMNRVIDRSRFLHSISDSDDARSYLKSDIPRLKHRARLLNRSVFFASLSAMTTALLIVVAFIGALLHVRHEYGVAIFFIVALTFFLFALLDLTRQTWMGLNDLDHHA